MIGAVTVGEDRPTGKRRATEAVGPTMATAAATLQSKLLTVEDTPLTAPERALMEQWLTTLADAPTAAPATPRRRRAREH